MWTAIYNRVVRVSLPDKVTIEQRLKGGRVSYAVMWGKRGPGSIICFTMNIIYLFVKNSPFPQR